MRLTLRALPILLLAALAGCDNGPTAFNGDQPVLRVVNAFTGPVDVLIDGAIASASVSAGAITSVYAQNGGHTLMIRQTGTTTSASQSVITSSNSLSTIAVVRSSSGSLATAILDDTGSVVAAGKTKVRVLHMAPNAGELQVYRTQPDYQVAPVSWQFPFTYQAQPNSLSAPFFESTVGTWEIHIWQTPTNASGWATAPVQIIIPLASGEKKTVLILDKVGGGVRYELL